MTRTWLVSSLSTKNGEPGATPMPCAARISRVSASPAVRDPQVDAVGPRRGHAPRRQRRHQPPAALGVGAPGPLHGLAGAVVGEHVEQHVLQEPARPRRAEAHPLGQRVDDRRRPSDGGQAEVGAVRLREALDAHHPVGQVAAQAEGRRRRDVALVVVLDHEQAVERLEHRRQRGRRAGVVEIPVGLWARGCRTSAVGVTRRARARASGRRPSRSSGTPTTLAPASCRRSSSGGNVGFSTTTWSPGRTVTTVTRSRASRAPSTTVSDSGSKSGPSRAAGAPRARAARAGRGSSTAWCCEPTRRSAGPSGGSSAVSGMPVLRSSANEPARPASCQKREITRWSPGSATKVPLEPRVSMTAALLQQPPGLGHGRRVHADGGREQADGRQALAGVQVAVSTAVATPSATPRAVRTVTAAARVSRASSAAGSATAALVAGPSALVRRTRRPCSVCGTDSTFRTELASTRGLPMPNVVRAAIVQTKWTGDKESMIERARGVRPRGRLAGRAGHVLPGALLRALLLPGAGRGVLRVRRVDPRRARPPSASRRWPRELGMVLVLPMYEQEQDGVLYNTAAVIDADGTYLGKYRKNHIPQVKGFWEKFYFRPGNLGYPVFDTAVGKVGVYICYDRHFPEGWRALGLNGAEIVFNPSATSRGLSSYLWKLEQPASAVANEYFVGAINRVGIETSATTTSTAVATSSTPGASSSASRPTPTSRSSSCATSTWTSSRRSATVGLLPRPPTRAVRRRSSEP